MKKVNLYVKECASCGSSHRMDFNQKHSFTDVWPYVGLCPKTSEPVEMKIETTIIVPK